MAYTVPELLRLSRAQLDELYEASPAGEIPDGDAQGTAIIAPGTSFTPELAQFINLFAWQGKVFDASSGLLRNKILPFGLNAIIAKVYKGESWLDGKESIVLDYADTSLVAHWIRDEIRQIGSGLYLGVAFWGRQRLLDFALQFTPTMRADPA